MKTTLEYLEEALEDIEEGLGLVSDPERPAFKLVPEYTGAKKEIERLIRKVKKDLANEFNTVDLSISNSSEVYKEHTSTS